MTDLRERTAKYETAMKQVAGSDGPYVQSFIRSCAEVFAKLEERVVALTDAANRRADYYEYARRVDCGVSAKTILHTLTGVDALLGTPSCPPVDDSDFGRCHRLLRRFPELRQRLPEVAERYPEWRPLVDAWAELEALYLDELPSGKCPRLWARMRELLGSEKGG